MNNGIKTDKIENDDSISASKKEYDKRRRRVNLSLSHEEYKNIEVIAKGYGYTVTEFVKSTAFLFLDESKLLSREQENMMFELIEKLRSIENSMYQIGIRCENDEFNELDFISARNKIVKLENMLTDSIKKL